MPKAASATQEQRKPQQQGKRSVEEQIIYNGELVAKLLGSEVWLDIVQPVLQESIAGVSGRFTNGYYYHGRITAKVEDANTIAFLAGYQKGLMDLSNHIYDFVSKKVAIEDARVKSKSEKDAPLYNPAAEDIDD